MSANLAVLVGNGLSIAFSQNLILDRITAEVIRRLTEKYEGRSDEVAHAMQKIARRARAENPLGDFESLIGAFRGQTDILDDLRSFALLTEDNHDMAVAISTVFSFVQRVQQRGIGYTLETIVDQSRPETGSFDVVQNFLRTVVDTFPNRVTIANLNYDALVLSALTADYKNDFCDLGAGWGPFEETRLSTKPFTAYPLRSSGNDLPDTKRIRLLDLHGSVTFWKVGGTYQKVPISTARDLELWRRFRELELWAFPLVVLANRQDKIDHVRNYPFSLAYEIADTDFRGSDYWLIVGYSFRDACVNDLLKRCWDARVRKPRILIITKGDEPVSEDVESAFGWEAGTLSAHATSFERDGVEGLAGSAMWASFASA